MSAAEPVQNSCNDALAYFGDNIFAGGKIRFGDHTGRLCNTGQAPESAKCNKKHLPKYPGDRTAEQHGAGGDLQRTDDPGFIFRCKRTHLLYDPCQNRKQNDITTYFRQYHKRMQDALIQNVNDISGIWFSCFRPANSADQLFSSPKLRIIWRLPRSITLPIHPAI